MSQFKVGDRVRIVGCFEDGPKHLIGQETKITGKSKRVSDGTGRYVFGYQVSIPNNRHFAFGFTADQLEPLTPPSAKTLTAEDILALPNLREADCPLPVPLRMMGLVSP